MKCYHILLFFFLAISLSAQPDRNQKFAAAGYFGINFSQIHGDSYFGYKNTGLRFGIETQYLLQPQYFVSIGIGFTQEGASPDQEEIEAKGQNAPKIDINMVEIPLLFNYRLGDKKAKGKKHNYALYQSTIIQAGLKLTRLIGYRTTNRGAFGARISNPEFSEGNIEFQDFDFAAVAGVTVPFGLKGSLLIQHSLSLRGLYRPEDVEMARRNGYDVFQLRPYSLTFGGKMVLY